MNHTHIDKQSMGGKGGHDHVFEDYLSNEGLFTFALDEALEFVFWAETRGNKIRSPNKKIV